jgi:hypothetical protein
MNPTPYSFVRQFTGAVVAALIPVVLVAFLSIPFNLGGHPGEVRTGAMPTPTHMT